jgi:hypothetical protein
MSLPVERAVVGVVGKLACKITNNKRGKKFGLSPLGVTKGMNLFLFIIRLPTMSTVLV